MCKADKMVVLKGTTMLVVVGGVVFVLRAEVEATVQVVCQHQATATRTSTMATAVAATRGRAEIITRTLPAGAEALCAIIRTYVPVLGVLLGSAAQASRIVMASILVAQGAALVATALVEAALQRSDAMAVQQDMQVVLVHLGWLSSKLRLR